jgi:hypothetical protein
MSQISKQLLALALFLGWTVDLLFWGKPVGISFAIFMTLCLVGGAYFLLANQLRPAKKSLWLVAPLAFLAAMTVLRREPLTAFLAYTLTIFSISLLVITWLGGRWMEYNLTDYFVKYLQLLVSMMGRPFELIAQTRKEMAESGAPKMKLPIWPAVRGLLIALPIVLFFGALLASADLVFGHQVATFFEQFDTRRIFEYILRLILIPAYAFCIAGIILHAATQSKDEKILGEDKPVIKPFLGFTETGIVLVSVGSLFLLFVAIQIRYFFGGEVNIGVEGYTYSEYARRGFNELLAVAFFSLLMILGLSTITKRESPAQKRIYSGLSIVIVAEVIVILVSSFQRITLANDWHGFSRLRIYPQVFLVWLGILFVTVVMLEIMQKERYFACAAALASIGFAVSLSILNVDALIVKHNVLRAVQGKHFNVTHLATLSTDAVPALMEEFQDPTLPAEVHEGIGAALLCHYYAPANELPPTWQSYNVSRWRAHQVLKEAYTQLEGYRTIGNKWDMRVRTPGSKDYLCQE